MNLFQFLDPDIQFVILFEIVRRPYQPPPLRFKIDILSEQQGHRCCYCGEPFLDPPDSVVGRRQTHHWRSITNHPHIATIEHIKAKANGGKAEWENEAAACYRCNTNRGKMDALYFFENRMTIMASRQDTKSARNKRRKQRRKQRKRIERVVGATGIEPVTFTMST